MKVQAKLQVRAKVQINYYAYGLKIAGISSRKLGDSYEGQLKNNYLYQGRFAELDEDIGWQDFFLRNYDAQIGRFVQQDPYGQFPSPYTGMGNDPVNLIDPSGGISWPPPGLSTLSTTAETAITLSEVVVRSVSTVSKSVSAISTGMKIASVTAKVFQVANVLNTAFNTLNVGGQPPIKISDYSYSKLEDGWKRRRNGQKIINQEDALKEFRDTDPTTNTCAIRFSYAVNDAGYPIPKKGTGTRVWAGKEGDQGNYIVGATEVKTYLSKIESPTVVKEHIKTKQDVDKLIAEIHDKTTKGRAIVVIVAGNPAKYGASGHVDLLYRDFMQDISMYGNYGDDLGPYLKEADHLASDLSVYIWRLSK